MSESYLVRLFVADPAVAAPGCPELGPDGHVHGVVVQLATGRELTFRDDESLIAAFHGLAERSAIPSPHQSADDASPRRAPAPELV